MTKILDDQLINYLCQIKDIYGDEIYFENKNTLKNNLESGFS